MADLKQPPKGLAGKPAVPPRPRLILAPGQDAIYSNVVRISHSLSELVFDFGRLLPGEADVYVKARVMMSPLSAKLLRRGSPPWRKLASSPGIAPKLSAPSTATSATTPPPNWTRPATWPWPWWRGSKISPTYILQATPKTRSR